MPAANSPARQTRQARVQGSEETVAAKRGSRDERNVQPRMSANARLNLIVEEGREDVVADARRPERVHPHVLQPERELHRAQRTRPSANVVNPQHTKASST